MLGLEASQGIGVQVHCVDVLCIIGALTHSLRQPGARIEVYRHRSSSASLCPSVLMALSEVSCARSERLCGDTRRAKSAAVVFAYESHKRVLRRATGTRLLSGLCTRRFPFQRYTLEDTTRSRRQGIVLSYIAPHPLPRCGRWSSPCSPL